MRASVSTCFWDRPRHSLIRCLNSIDTPVPAGSCRRCVPRTAHVAAHRSNPTAQLLSLDLRNLSTVELLVLVPLLAENGSLVQVS